MAGKLRTYIGFEEGRLRERGQSERKNMRKGSGPTAMRDSNLMNLFSLVTGLVSAVTFYKSVIDYKCKKCNNCDNGHCNGC
jgi:hypothetical protein